MSNTQRVISGGQNAANGIYKIYIGRPSKFGNPFVIGKDGTREEVIAKYKNYFHCRLELQTAAIDELKDKTLVCHCSPLACHGDVIAEWLQSLKPKSGSLL